MSSRVEARRAFDTPTRLTLVEGDLDGLEGGLGAFREEIAGEVKSLRTVLIGILISVATAAILLAINVGIGALSQGGT